MRAVFADTFNFLAALNPHDSYHLAAKSFSQQEIGKMVTTAWVITEVADGCAGKRHRSVVSAFLNQIDRNPFMTVLPPSEELFEAGISLFLRRSDKEWSLTDCISFVAMKRLGLSEALTADRHFQQAGFIALFG